MSKKAENIAEDAEIMAAPVMQVIAGVGTVSRALILKAYKSGKHLTNEELAAKVQKLFEGKGIKVNTSAASIAWYKTDMRKKAQLPKGFGSSGAKSIEFNVDEIDL